MKILIAHPDLRLLGGIESYYKKLDGKFSLPVGHFVLGKRPGESGSISQFTRMCRDYLQFFRRIRKGKYDVVIINPSLEYKAFTREGIFLRLARLRGRKTVVFFRGWQKSFQAVIENEKRWLFDHLYGNADAFIVLSQEFESVLRSWGCRQPIFREVTIANDAAVNNFDFESALRERLAAPEWRIIFPARMLEAKGVYTMLDIQGILRKKYPNITLDMLGDGPELPALKTYVEQRHIDGVTFTGFVDGKEKDAYFRRAHLFCFPSRHGEGFPNAMVESMAYGLPVVTSRVGGIGDFFRNKTHGFASREITPIHFAALVEKIFLDKNMYATIARNNHQYALDNFLASQAAARLENICKSLLED